MKIRKLAVVSALAIASMGIASGTAYADPATEPSDTQSVELAPHINYTANVQDKAVVITTDAGSLTVVGGQFQVLANDGALVAGAPLIYRMNGKEFPIEASIDGNTATLTPITDVARSVDAGPASVVTLQDIASYKTWEEREKAAFGRAKDEISFGIAIGALVGTVTGGIVGCVIGGTGLGVVGGTVVPLLGFLPAAVVGCLAGGAILAPVGTVAGAIFIGAPIAIGSAINYFSIINAPFEPAK